MMWYIAINRNVQQLKYSQIHAPSENWLTVDPFGVTYEMLSTKA